MRLKELCDKGKFIGYYISKGDDMWEGGQWKVTIRLTPSFSDTELKELGPWKGKGFTKKDAEEEAASEALCELQPPAKTCCKEDVTDDAYVGDAALDLFLAIVARRQKL
jgi:hypothetical protein